MAKTTQLTFYIYLTDQARVLELQAQYPLGVSRGPLPAATEFEAPFIAEGAAVTYPCTRTGWLPPGASGKFPLDRAFFTINDGFWGHLFGRDQKYAWIGQFVYQPAVDAVPSGGGSLGPMRQIVWAQGFEHYGVTSNAGAETETGSNFSQSISRDASRTPDGCGLAVRGVSISVQHNWAQFAAAPTYRGWERLYVRLRALPDSDRGFWRCRATVSTEQLGLVLMVNSTGALVLRIIGATGTVGDVIGTTEPLDLNRWYLLDVFWTMGDSDTSTEPSVEDVSIVTEMWVDHVQAIAGTGVRSTGVVDPSTYTMDFSEVGYLGFGSGTGLELDIDDWIAFNLPAADSTHPPQNAHWKDDVPGPEQPPGVDWYHGHHVAYVEPHAFDATHSANWTGNVRTLTQRAGGAGNVEDALTSSTSGALLAANTRADLVGRADGVLGIQGLVVSCLYRRATGGSPSLGFTLNGSTTVDTAQTGQTANDWDWVLYAPSGLTTPLPLNSLMLRFTKAADANLTTVAAMFATVVLVGDFQACDRYPTEEELPEFHDPITRGIHNAPYPRTPFVRSEVPPDSPVWVKAGTYTGNSLGQDIIAKIPAHFWWVRRTDSTTGAVRWWSSMVAAIWGLVGDHRAGVNYALEDPEFVADGSDAGAESRSLLRVGGANAAHNLNAATYQYLAIGDPGSRFMLNGALRHQSAVVSKVNALTDPDFLAEWGWFVSQFPDGLGNGNVFAKGPGHAASGIQNAGAVAEAATGAIFAAGLLTSLATLHPSGGLSQVAYTLWRQRDGGDYDGYDLTEPVVVQIMSFVGDGTASRTIALPRTSGKRPLWAWAQPVSGVAAYVRDPSHTSNTSSLASAGSATITTGFTAGGVDSVTVGTTLNVNGVVTNLFVVMAADATAGNNGWGTNGEVFYDPIPAPGGQWGDGYTQEELDALENPTTPEEVDSFDDGPDLADDLADTVCVPFTLRAVNLALARIGISDKVTAAADLLTPTSQERSLVVEFYETALRYVLRDYPWAHATRYASLVLIDGSISDPVNADWVYSFRAPTGCLFVRRVIRPELGRKHDAKPPAFRLSVDDVGPLVYVTDDGVQFDSNDEPFVEIEYTVRPGCGARAGGDQKFVSAFAYRLAFELATALSRDEKTIARMERGYLIEKSSASTTVGNEQQTQPPGDPDWLLGR